MKYYIGVDVGTGSVRASVCDQFGKILNQASSNLKIWEGEGSVFVQSSADVWKSVVTCIKGVTEGLPKDEIRGLGFDATCSLGVFDTSLEPLSVCPSGEPERNIILWMDHRAVREAADINACGHEVLNYVGGKMSPEMQMPKLLWIKRNMPDIWRKIGKVFDLPDFLTWKATGMDSRSLCSLVCKWGYLCRSEKNCAWATDFITQIGLQELLDDNFSKIGSTILNPGEPIKGGLSEASAQELGLLPGTPVGTSIIDAHAGALGMIGGDSAKEEDFETRLGLICGTSSCHMSLSKTPKFIPGVWGPYYGAVLPGYWLNEAGQSATGKLIDHVIQTHPAYKAIHQKTGDSGIYSYLEDLLKTLCNSNGCSLESLTRDLHVYPDFHGNRSPLADPDMKGMVCGLNLDTGEVNLAKLYAATIQGLAYGTRNIVEALTSAGYHFKEIVMCGGLVKSRLFVQTHADVLQMRVLLPREKESVLLGSSMLALYAAGDAESLIEASVRLAGPADVVEPFSSSKEYHDSKYRIFLDMREMQQRITSTMSQLL